MCGTFDPDIFLVGCRKGRGESSDYARRATARPRPGQRTVHLLVDSTGLKLCGPGEWLFEKHAAKVRRSCKAPYRVDADQERSLPPS